MGKRIIKDSVATWEKIVFVVICLMFIAAILFLSGCSHVQYYSQYRWGYQPPASCENWDGYVAEGYYHNYHNHTYRDFGCNPPALPPAERIWKSVRYGKQCWFGRCEGIENHRWFEEVRK